MIPMMYDDTRANEIFIWNKWKAINQLNRFERYIIIPCYHIVSSTIFEIIIISCIIINTIILAIDHYQISSSLLMFLNVSNLIFTIIFTIEMILKILAYSLSSYWLDSFNRFDCFIVILSILEYTVKGDGVLSALRAFRLLRVFKLLRSWSSFQSLLQAILLSFTDLYYYFFILIIFIYIYAVLGNQLFRNGFIVTLEQRTSFRSVPWAALTVFQLISGENWNDVLYQGIADFGWLSSIYFVTLFVFGNYIIISIFLAILLANYNVADNVVTDHVQQLSSAINNCNSPDTSIISLTRNNSNLPSLTLKLSSNNEEEISDDWLVEDFPPKKKKKKTNQKKKTNHKKKKKKKKKKKI